MDALKPEPLICLVGLGNPGSEYALTPHNAGFMCLDFAVQQWGGVWEKSSLAKALVSKISFNGCSFLCLKPLTYMNLSGQVVAKYAQYYKIKPSQIAVVYDDIELDMGKIKLSLTQARGSHNGIRSIVDILGSGFFRLRVGVGPKPLHFSSLSDYVLSRLSEEQLNLFSQVILPDCLQKFQHLILEGPERLS